MTNNEIMKIWSTAVHNVGGRYNTKENFINIAKEFTRIGIIEGLTEDQIEREIESNLEATIMYMEE